MKKHLVWQTFQQLFSNNEVRKVQFMYKGIKYILQHSKTNIEDYNKLS